MSTLCSFMQRCLFAAALGLDFGTSGEQQTDHGLVSNHYSSVQRCPIGVVLGLDLGSSVEQQTDYGLMSTLYSTV